VFLGHDDRFQSVQNSICRLTQGRIVPGFLSRKLNEMAQINVRWGHLISEDASEGLRVASGGGNALLIHTLQVKCEGVESSDQLRQVIQVHSGQCDRFL